MNRPSTSPQSTERATGNIAERRAELGSLSQCMVDADSDVLARARRLRGRALVLSVTLQAVCIVALLIGPLLAAPGALPPPTFVTPVPPYRGGEPRTNPQTRRVPERSVEQLPANRLLFPTAEARTPVHEVSGEEAPDVGADVGNDLGLGPGPAGAWIPGGSDNGVRVRPPRQPAAPRKPVLRSEGVMAGALVHRVDPVYPKIALAIHLSGTVRLRAIIGTDGTVQNLEVLSGSPILARAGVDAVRQWRYRPTLLNGQPVEVETYITVNFVLGE
jgi:periplasmic protein TonB